MKLPREVVEYKLFDTVMDENQAVNYLTEFLNSLKSPEMPPYLGLAFESWIISNVHSKLERAKGVQQDWTGNYNMKTEFNQSNHHQRKFKGKNCFHVYQ